MDFTIIPVDENLTVVEVDDAGTKYDVTLDAGTGTVVVISTNTLIQGNVTFDFGWANIKRATFEAIEIVKGNGAYI